MIRGAKYAHTNLIAKDWRALARFYQDVFGCTVVPPERDLFGPELEAGTGIPEARIRGVHLRLPGYPGDGPVLEIFEYAQPAPPVSHAVDRPGFGHIAFSVRSVPEAREAFLSHGGSAVGRIATLDLEEGRRITFCYVADPEGNVVELMSEGAPKE